MANAGHSSDTPSSSRQLILDEAEKLICRNGYAAFSFGQLEDRVGIGKAGIHHHFRRKDDLLVVLLLRCIERQRRQLEGLTVANRLVAYVELLEAECAPEGLSLSLALLPSVAEISERARSALLDYQDQQIDWLEREFVDIIPPLARRQHHPRDLAEYMLSSIVGAMGLGRAAGDASCARRTMVTVLQSLIALLRAAERQASSPLELVEQASK